MDTRDCSEHTDPECRVHSRLYQDPRSLQGTTQRQKETESNRVWQRVCYDDSWGFLTDMAGLSCRTSAFCKRYPGVPSAACNSNTHAYLLLCILEDSATAFWYVQLFKNYRGRQFSKESFDNGWLKQWKRNERAVLWGYFVEVLSYHQPGWIKKHLGH